MQHEVRSWVRAQFTQVTGYVIKGGWLRNLSSLGYTAFSIDREWVNDAIQVRQLMPTAYS